MSDFKTALDHSFIVAGVLTPSRRHNPIGALSHPHKRLPRTPATYSGSQKTAALSLNTVDAAPADHFGDAVRGFAAIPAAHLR